MARVQFDINTTLAPEAVVKLLTDFSPQRPERWPGLDPKLYEVYSVTDTSAEVREGGPSTTWAKERYDWSTPGKVRWEVLESSFCKPGSFVQANINANPSGGSAIHFEWERKASNPMGAIITTLVRVTGGAPVKASFEKGLRKAEGTPAP